MALIFTRGSHDSDRQHFVSKSSKLLCITSIIKLIGVVFKEEMSTVWPTDVVVNVQALNNLLKNINSMALKIKKKTKKSMTNEKKKKKY